MLFYKYQKFSTFLRTLKPECVSLKLSVTSEFNDAMDGCAYAVNEPTEHVAMQYYEQDAVLQFKVDGTCSHAKDAIWTARLRQEALSHFNSQLIRQEFFDYATRLFCVSGVDESHRMYDPLMWCHYADQFNGVRLTFDFTGLNVAFENVRYKETPPFLDFKEVKNFALEDPAMAAFLHRRVFTKGRAWFYENEYRAIFDVLKNNIDDVEGSFGLLPAYWHPNKSCVVAVDIGYRAWRDEGKRLQFLKRVEDLRNAGYDKVIFGIALPDFSNYNYLIKPIDLNGK